MVYIKKGDVIYSVHLKYPTRWARECGFILNRRDYDASKPSSVLPCSVW